MDKLSNLDAWLNVETWHTGHPKDDERFYKAIYQVLSADGTNPEPEGVRDHIIEKKKGEFEPGYLRLRADEAMSRYDAVSSLLYENNIKL